jgi:hypothetical protein
MSASATKSSASGYNAQVIDPVAWNVIHLSEKSTSVSLKVSWTNSWTWLDTVGPNLERYRVVLTLIV